MRLTLWAAFAASTLVGITLGSAKDARADKGDRFGNSEERSRKSAGQADKEKAGKGKAEKGGKRVALAPAGLKFGMGVEAIAKLYDKQFDAEYLPLYKRASPGPETDALDAEIKQKKLEVRRSKVDFGQTPTGVDQTPLKGEYSYANGESMARMTLRSGTERFFFFFGDKLWKVYDAHKLKKGGPLGETFDEAIKNLSGKLGGPPKRIPARPADGQNFDEAHWTTPDMLIRALDRGDVLAVVWVDRDVQGRLPELRKNKMKDQHKLDADVANALKKNEPPPDAKKDEKKEGGKKK